ncbi:hypothetical protein SNEBB_005073 [Seison nebaliae]|nr:hypothetical protein SNEBB_005073 [Seison nebaliae]
MKCLRKSCKGQSVQCFICGEAFYKVLDIFGKKKVTCKSTGKKDIDWSSVREPKTDYCCHHGCTMKDIINFLN